MGSRLTDSLEILVLTKPFAKQSFNKKAFYIIYCKLREPYNC